MLVGCNTPELQQVAADILLNEIGVQPSADQRAILWVDPKTRDVEWCVGYNAFIGKTCQMHVVNLKGKSTPRTLICAAFDYAFNTAGREVVFGVLNSANPHAVEYDRTGATVAFSPRDDGGDIVLLQMRRDECRWIKELKHAA